NIGHFSLLVLEETRYIKRIFKDVEEKYFIQYIWLSKFSAPIVIRPSENMLWEGIIIVVLLILIYYLYYDTLAFGPYNTKAVSLGSEKYQVHRAHSDTQGAAQLLAEINVRSETLITHLRGKYMNSDPSVSMDPTKNNRIDIIPGTSMYSESDLGNDVVELLSNPMHKEYLQERIVQLTHNYSPSRIYEISPLNTGDATSYTEDKK